jgi:hypothetical protein
VFAKIGKINQNKLLSLELRMNSVLDELRFFKLEGVSLGKYRMKQNKM